MSNRPLQWIEQAEARQVMTDAIYRQIPAASWSRLVGKAVLKPLQYLRCEAFSNIVPKATMVQAQPVLAYRPQRALHHPDDYGKR
jgi:hypothetical protein